MALGLLRTALWFKADVALIDSGCTHYFVCGLFRLFGIRVIPILHNSLWPNGFPPRKLIPRMVNKLDSLLLWAPHTNGCHCRIPGVRTASRLTSKQETLHHISNESAVRSRLLREDPAPSRA